MKAEALRNAAFARCWSRTRLQIVKFLLGYSRWRSDNPSRESSCGAWNSLPCLFGTPYITSGQMPAIVAHRKAVWIFELTRKWTFFADDHILRRAPSLLLISKFRRKFDPVLFFVFLSRRPNSVLDPKARNVRIMNQWNEPAIKFPDSPNYITIHVYVRKCTRNFAFSLVLNQ